MNESKSKKRILRLLRDGKPIVPSRDWIDLTELARDGLVETRKAPNGQVEFGLTEAGKAAL